MPRNEERDLQYVRDCIEHESFDYAFTGYSDFKEVKDPEFHRLREAYLTAQEELQDYIWERTEGEF